ncbi:MAG: glycosyltransferase family 2 protein [Ferruginibacter sp.]
MNEFSPLELVPQQQEGSGKTVCAGLPSVAIVILNWNGKHFLEKFLPFVLASTYVNKRVIIADNASTDDSISFLRNQFPSVEIIQNSRNEGFAKGYNNALKQVRSEYYVLLNSDVEVNSGWIEPVIELMSSDPMIAACQPKVLDHNNKKRFEYAGAAGGWIDKFGYPFTRGRVFDVCEDDNGQYDTVQQCFWATGAALFVKAKYYNELGGMDEYFFAHQEEIDLCWRLQLAGYKIFAQPKSVVYHVGGGTLPKGNNRKTFLNFRNNLVMIYKNSSWQTALWKIPARELLDGVAAWKALFSGDPGFFIAIVNAHVHFVKWLLFIKYSKPVRAKEHVLAGWYNGSIVWDHFIKKKKRFSEIIISKKPQQ